MDFIVSINKPQLFQVIAYSFSRVNLDMTLKNIQHIVDDIHEDIHKAYDNTTIPTNDSTNMLEDIAFAIRTRIYRWHKFPDCNIEVNGGEINFLFPDTSSIRSGVIILETPKAYVRVH